MWAADYLTPELSNVSFRASGDSMQDAHEAVTDDPQRSSSERPQPRMSIPWITSAWSTDSLFDSLKTQQQSDSLTPKIVFFAEVDHYNIDSTWNDIVST